MSNDDDGEDTGRATAPKCFTTFEPEEYKELFFIFLEKYCSDQLKEMVLAEDPYANYSISIEYPELKNEDEMGIADQLLEYPYDILPLFDESLVEVQDSILNSKDLQHAIKEGANPSVKYKSHVRIYNLPTSVLQLNKTNLPRSNDVEKFVEVRGTVIRTGMAKTLEFSKEYRCTKCKEITRVQVEPEQMDRFKKPTSCQIHQANGHGPCLGKSFTELENKTETKDYQEIKIQEQVHKLGMGSIPRSMVVILLDDLVDKCQAGDDITLSGIVLRRWRFVREGARPDLEVVLLANHLIVNNEKKFGVNMTDELQAEFAQYWQDHANRPLEGRDNILSNVCAGVHGMYIVKLALALSLIGGVARYDERNTRIRGEVHLLLVGEPGTGKSQFLRYAAKLGTRSVLTTGIGTTSAGLTVSAMKDQGGEWILEAGALVLADGGVCCIDEFASIKERDRASIHEAMEQQMLNVAKAGLVCKLHTRTTVVAATNAKGGYDPDKSISVNTAIASPLLSRFDIVIILRDDMNEEWDKCVSDHILRGHQIGGHAPVWPLEKMQAYFAYIKGALNPVLTPESHKILMNYYLLQRKIGGENAGMLIMGLECKLIVVSSYHDPYVRKSDPYRASACKTDVPVGSGSTRCCNGGSAHGVFSYRISVDGSEFTTSHFAI